MRSRDVGHAKCAASWTATDGWWPARVFWRSSLGRSAWAAANLSTPHRVRPGAVSSCDRTRAGRACAAGTGFDTRIGARTHKGRGAQRMAATARSPAWPPRPTQPPRQGRAVVNGTARRAAFKSTTSAGFGSPVPTRDTAQSNDIPACRNSGPVSRSSARITGPIRCRGTSQRREPGSHAPPARRKTASSSRGARTATRFPSWPNSAGPTWAGRGGASRLLRLFRL